MKILSRASVKRHVKSLPFIVFVLLSVLLSVYASASYAVWKLLCFYGVPLFQYLTHCTIVRVTTCLENLEMSGNLITVSVMSGILLKVRECVS